MEKVELRELGKTGLKISSVGFGASPLGNVFGPVSDQEAIASVRRAFDLGINFFDTSPWVFTHFFVVVMWGCLICVKLWFSFMGFRFYCKSGVLFLKISDQDSIFLAAFSVLVAFFGGFC